MPLCQDCPCAPEKAEELSALDQYCKHTHIYIYTQIMTDYKTNGLFFIYFRTSSYAHINEFVWSLKVGLNLGEQD